MTRDPKYLVVDLFCGAGGTTTGFEMTNGIARVIACVNHDHMAIESHWRNHRHVRHFNEDIRTLDLTKLMNVVNWWTARHPSAKLILWASLECTNFSKAKGGQPRDADSRTLAQHLHRYIEAMNPDMVMIENVVEFMAWGPLDENGKPISKKNGQDWLRWRKKVCKHGYVDEWKEMNSADFGAFTSRNRLFGMFARNQQMIQWPEPTHSKNPSKGGLFASMEKWKPVKEVLNFKDEGQSIFTRKKPLSDKTLERIYAGLIKYVAKGDKAFISKYFSGKPANKNIPVNGPAGTIKCIDSQALIQASFITQRNTGDPKSKIVDINGPARTLTGTGGNQDIVFLSKYHGNGANCRSVEEPAPTLDTGDRIAVVKSEYFIDKTYTGYRNNQSIDDPAGSILPTDKHRLVECNSFVMPTNYDNKPKSVDEPCPTIQASRRHTYIVNPSHGGHSTGTDAPCPVIIARQDKAPLYLVQAEEGNLQIAVYPEDSEICIKIKVFMCHFNLVDIKMRMLRVQELLKIQGFPSNYILKGTQTDQKKFIGNSVVPLVVKHWIEAININSEQLAA